MTRRSTGAVADTVTKVSPTRSPGLMALRAARRSIGKITIKGSFTRGRNANSGIPRSLRRKAASIFPFERPSASSGEYYHHVDVRQLVAQDLQSFGHPGQFVSGKKAHSEAWFGRMGDPPCSFGSRFSLR